MAQYTSGTEGETEQKPVDFWMRGKITQQYSLGCLKEKGGKRAIQELILSSPPKIYRQMINGVKSSRQIDTGQSAWTPDPHPSAAWEIINTIFPAKLTPYIISPLLWSLETETL